MRHSTTPEPVKEVDDMSEAELNAMIDAMAAQVSEASPPSSTFSPASQFSPASGSPPSTFPTPSSSRIGSATYPNRTPASGSPAGGDPSLAVSGRTSAAAFKRPVLKMLGLPSNPRSGGGNAASSLSMAPGALSRVSSSPESRRSTEGVGQASSRRATTPPAQGIRFNQTPSPPLVTDPVQPPEHPSREEPPTPSIPTPRETTVNPPASTSAHDSQATLPPQPPPPAFPLPVPPAPQTPEMDFEIIPTPEYERDGLSLKPNFSSLDTSMAPPLASSQAIDSPRNLGSFMSPAGNKTVDMALPPGAGPPRRPGDIVLPESRLPGGTRDSPVPPQSPERSHSLPSSGSFNHIPSSLRPGTPRSPSPAQQDFTGVGSLARTSRDRSRKLSNNPSSAGPPSLMPLDLYSPTLDFGEFGGAKGNGAGGLLQEAPSRAGYGEGKFMTNLEDEYKQGKADPKRGSGSWR